MPRHRVVRGDRLLHPALGPAVDVIRDRRVTDPAGLEAVGEHRGELVLVGGPEAGREAHQQAVPALDREQSARGGELTGDGAGLGLLLGRDARVKGDLKSVFLPHGG